MFHEHILARHAHVRATVLHIGGHIRGANDQQAHPGDRGAKHQLPAFLRILFGLNASTGEKRQCFFQNTALGKGNGQLFRHSPVSVCGGHEGIRRMVAPSSWSFSSMHS